jgi:hypothetical protein
MIAAPKKIPKKAMMNVKSLDMVKTAINGLIRSMDCESIVMDLLLSGASFLRKGKSEYLLLVKVTPIELAIIARQKSDESLCYG